MVIKTAEFIVSNTDYKNCPKVDKLEYAFIGRSNVGKSSLINALANKKSLAKTSGKPGKTQLINHFLINKEWYLVDLPGYGFAKSGHSRRKDWGPLLGEYFEKRQSLKAVVVFMDIRHPLKPIDLEMIELCENFDVPFIPVLTKSDKVSNNVCASTQQKVLKETNAPHVIAISALKGTNCEKLGKILLKYVDG